MLFSVLLKPLRPSGIVASADMQERRRSQPHTFEDQIAAEKARCEEQLAQTRHAPERDTLVKKLRQLETASHMNDWLKSPGLRSPE